MKPHAAAPAEIDELLRLVRSGKLFAVQKWIQAGKSPRTGCPGAERAALRRTSVLLVELCQPLIHLGDVVEEVVGGFDFDFGCH